MTVTPEMIWGQLWESDGLFKQLGTQHIVEQQVVVHDIMDYFLKI